MKKGFGMMLVGLALFVPAGDALAAGTPGTTYVLDANRSGAGKIVAISPKGKVRTVPGPQGVGIEPMVKPLGITVDAQGFLVVAISDGYGSTYKFPEYPDRYACVNGCGAVIRVNPDTGAAVVLSTGPYWSNPSAVLLPPDGDITDGSNDYLLVSDLGDWAIERVDLSQGLGVDVESNQSYFFDNRKFSPPNMGKAQCEASQACGGLRRPWDLTYDPTNGDILVANVGAYPESFPGGVAVAPALTGVSGCDDDPSAPGFSERGGYIVRLHPGASPRYYCDDDLVAPRGVVAGKNGSAYLTDPFSINGTSFAGAFTLTGRAYDPLSGGDLLEVPSGITADYSGKRLLVADEISGLIRINPDGGAQARVGGVSGQVANAIDVAVDRRRGGKVLPPPVQPPQPSTDKPRPPVVKTLSFFGRDGRAAKLDSGGGLANFPVWGLLRGARVRLECKSGGCPAERVASDADLYFDFSSKPLKGEFKVITYVPLRKGSGKRIVKNTSKVVWKGRYRVFRYSGGSLVEVDEGCLEPGAAKVVKHGRNATRAKCPAA